MLTKLYGDLSGSTSSSANDPDMNGSSSAATLSRSASVSPVPHPWITTAPSETYFLSSSSDFGTSYASSLESASILRSSMPPFSLRQSMSPSMPSLQGVPTSPVAPVRSA